MLARRVLLAVLGFNGVTAVAGGIGLLTGLIVPGLGLLAGSVFHSYAVPGWSLLGVGLLSLVAGGFVHRRARLAWLWAGLAGGGMVVFELVELATIGYHWLQGVYLATGALAGLLALRLLARRHLQEPAAPKKPR